MKKSRNLEKSIFLRRLLLWLLVSFSVAQMANAQAFVVRGTVTDQNDGTSLPGVNIVEQGTRRGTISDVEGKYEISVSGPDAMLRFTYIGYLDEEILVDGRAEINVSMALSVAMLSEMVVIGYGVVRKDDLTGSVAVVTSEDLTRIPATTFSGALQGRAAGVMVTQSGDPGTDAQIRVRGIGSINQNPDPIYVIDGVITSSLGSVQPTDIESVQVLKDASAAAIYGADGANGVIIITTKRGMEGPTRFEYSSFATFTSVPRQFEVMDASQYSAFYSTLLDEAEIVVPTSYSDHFRQWYYGDAWQQGTDWQNELTRGGFGHNHNFRISGGGTGSNFSISANYFNQDGILIASAAERFNLRANSDFELGKYVRVGESLSISHNAIQTPSSWQGNPWQVSLIASPLMRMYNEDNKGGYEGPQISYIYPNQVDPNDSIVINTGFNDKPNPVGPIETGDFRTQTTNILTNIYLEIKPVDWLTFKTTPSVDGSFIRTKNWFPAFDLGVRSREQATLEEYFYEGLNLSLENQLTFSETFGKHSVTATAVHHVRRNHGYDISATASRFPYENLNTIAMSYSAGRQVVGGYLPFSALSYLGRVIYDYNSKYLITASLRKDGNSRFGPENRWGTFPSVSLAWKVNEDFLRNVEQVSLLKLRAGWGKTGNSNIGYFEYQSLLDGFEQFSPVFGVDHVMLPALNVVHSFGNPALRWEAAEMLNFGIDINMLQDKVQFSADYYIKNQNDLLIKVPVSSAHGRNYQGEAGETEAGDPWLNIGEIQNRGFEFNALYSEMGGKLNYNISANFTTIKNEVLYIPADILTTNNLTSYGHTIGSFYGHVAERIITPADFDEEGNYLFARPATGVPSPGDLMFKDLNNDGIVNDLDRTIIGKAVPDFTYSMNIELLYSGFDLSVFLYGMHNYQIYNHLRAGIEGFSSQDMGHNKTTDFAMNYYREDRPSTEYIRADLDNTNQNDRPSTWYLENASFFRLKDVQLGYTLPERVAAIVGLKRARFYVSGSNLYTLTSYTGRDPEAPATGSPISPGNDSGTYPVPKAYTFGIQVGI